MSECKYKPKSKFMKVLGAIILALGVAFVLGSLCSCTFSLSSVNTHGQASDVIDEEQGASPVISPSISVPAI
jgi:hypothetical protein